MSQKFKVHFGESGAGSLAVSIGKNEQIVYFHASSFLYPSLWELIESLRSLINIEYKVNRQVVRWATEPIEYEFIFDRQYDRVSLEILEFSNSTRIKGVSKSIFKINESVESIVLPFWRALRELETRHDFERQWQRPFPKLEMKKLNREIDFLKKKFKKIN
jgi:hypothetical protein